MAKPIKITKCEVFGLRIPFDKRVRENMIRNYQRENSDRADYTPWIVRISTDAGITGIGEANAAPGPGASRVVGRSVWELLHDGSFGGAIMIAVYDVVGQAVGLPVCRLFSTTPRKTIQQIWWSHSFRPALMAAEAKLGVQLGYRVHKIKARPYEDTAEQVAAMVGAVPQDYQILVDANGSYGSAGKTLAVAEALKKYPQVKGFEQPIAHEDIVGYREIRKHLPFRLAVHWEAVDTRAFILESICDAFVVEDWHWGPALMAKGAMCELSGQKLWVENGLFSGISQVFQAHITAALPEVEYTISLTHIAEDDIVVEPFTLKDGVYHVPQKPGLGVTLDEAALKKYRVV